MFREHRQNGLKWHTFSIFDPYPELRHGVFSRHGGQSGPNGDELWLAFNEVDPLENVQANLSRAEAALNLPPVALVRQTHSPNVALVRPADRYQPRRPQEVWPDYDALVAPEPGPSLLIKMADCQGVLLFDPVSRALGLVHSGWRGSVQNVIGRTVLKMAGLGVRPADLLAAVSPSLGPCCAEFVRHRQELPPEFQEFQVTENHFDFWAISRRQLASAGLAPENVTVAGICTKCSPEYFSYRRGDRWARFGLLAGVSPRAAG